LETVAVDTAQMMPPDGAKKSEIAAALSWTNRHARFGPEEELASLSRTSVMSEDGHGVLKARVSAARYGALIAEQPIRRPWKHDFDADDRRAARYPPTICSCALLAA
jgi:hypothetical protein